MQIIKYKQPHITNENYCYLTLSKSYNNMGQIVLICQIKYLPSSLLIQDIKINNTLTCKLRLMGNANKIQLEHGPIITKTQFSSYSNQIRNIYTQIFFDLNDESTQEMDNQQNDQINLEKVLGLEPHPTPMPVCQRNFNHQVVFRCYDCSLHRSAIICIQCFQKGNHKGHRYKQMDCDGGICDCGNPDVIKSEGFCEDHPGKAKAITVDLEENEKFRTNVGVIFEWLFRMSCNPSYERASEYLGVLLAKFLLGLNQGSLYYNTLTYGLLFSERKFAEKEQQRKKKVIQSLFECGKDLKKTSKIIIDLFFSIFSLEAFKYELMISFAEAYNTVQDFQHSEYIQLYVQLFAHNENVERMLDQRKLVLYPTKPAYSLRKYINSLNFVDSMKNKEVVSKYYRHLIQKGPVQFPLLKGLQQYFSYVNPRFLDYLYQAINTEALYYTLVQSMVEHLKDHQQSLVLMLNNYLETLMDKQFTYKNNKLVKPFHRTFGIILLAIADGDIDNLSVESVQKMVGHKYKVEDIFSEIFLLVSDVFKELSQNFYQGSQRHLSNLYIVFSKCHLIYDLLLFKICLHFFQQTKSQQLINSINLQLLKMQSIRINNQQQALSHSLSELNHLQEAQSEKISKDPLNYEQECQELSQNSKQSQNTNATLNRLKVNCQILKIFIEACVSKRPQISVANKVNLSNQNLNLKTELLFISVMMNFKQISEEEFDQINRIFLSKFNNSVHLIKNFLIFDKSKKKYSLKEQTRLHYCTLKEPLFLYPTVNKLGGIFETAQQNQNVENLLKKMQLSREIMQKLSFLFNDDFLNQVIDVFIEKLIKMNVQQDESKEFQETFVQFLDVMLKLEILMKSNIPKSIAKLNKSIQSLSSQEKFYFLKEKVKIQKYEESPNKKKGEDKIKYDQKRKKKLERIRKMQEAYNPVLEKNEQKFENESFCIICREDCKQSLCFLADFKFSNIFEGLNKVNGRSLIFSGCFHPIHMKCFIESTRKQQFKCPLCKSSSSIMLPFEKSLSDEMLILQIYQRIITLKAVMTEDSKGEKLESKFQEFNMLSILRSISSMIGKNLLRKEPILNQKDQRLANILYGMLKAILYSERQNQLYKRTEIQGIAAFIELLEQKTHSSRSTNYHAVQYVIIAVLFFCLSNKSAKCSSISKQKTVKFINKDDLKKIWQMCDQIVSLPHFQLVEELQKVNQMPDLIQFYEPPESVVDLIKLRDSYQNHCKQGHEICVCIICHEVHCLDCHQLQVHYKINHCTGGIALDLMGGKLAYFEHSKLVAYLFIYCNQIGSKWNPSESPDEFYLDKDTYQGIKESLLEEKTDEYLKQKIGAGKKK